MDAIDCSKPRKSSIFFFVLCLAALRSYVQPAVLAPTCGLRMSGGDLPPKEPIFLRNASEGRAGFSLIEPNGPVLHVDGELWLACSGIANSISGLGNDTASMATCAGDTHFQVGKQKLNITDLTCLHTITGDIIATHKPCANGTAELLTIGYDFTQTPIGSFVYLFEVCYNSTTGSAVYAKHSLLGKSIKNHEITSERPSFKSTGTAEHVSPAVSYTQASQLIQFGKLLGESQAEKYINSKSYLARGHMAPDADFIFGAWRFSTYFYVNVCPEWQIVNAGNWLRVENMARHMADTLQETLTVITGCHGVLQLPNERGVLKDIYLEDNGGIIVPKFFWKVIYSATTKEGIALVMLNNPFVESVVSGDYICRDISEETNWAVEAFSNTTKGVTYGCDVGDLRKVVTSIPKLTVNKVMGFPDTYILETKLASNGRKRSGPPPKPLVSDERVLWADKLVSYRREKRDFIEINEYLTDATNITTDSEEERQLTRVKRRGLGLPHRNTAIFNDELWSQEWYLQDTRSERSLPKLDLNVLPVYTRGITGKGVRVAILDDGLEHLHDDLIDNYDPDISWDCNNMRADPVPNYSDGRNGHGTRCAGEVAMAADNWKCGVGVAFRAKIGGIKLLDGIVNDRIEGIALGFARHLVDIYSASWGPSDDGMTVEGPGRLAKEAMARGIREGRQGKGVIYVWASGNGGNKGDNCNCDGYTSSIYTVSVGSASQKGSFPWYGELCPSTLTVTYSSGAYEDQMIATTDLHNECTIKHTGTSASAPLAAGIIALALEVNPNLTWRDVQHLIVWTSEYTPLADNSGWLTNQAGLRYNTRFGFGLMNADSMVTQAANWSNVFEQSTCYTRANQIRNSTLVYGHWKYLYFATTGCSGEFTKSENEIGSKVVYLEHVELEANVIYTRRGVLEIFLTSPSGTRVQLLGVRKLDDSRSGFIAWRFMSVASWGENPKGVWKVDIGDMVGAHDNKGYVGNFTLILHGTDVTPSHYKNGPRHYNDKYNRRTQETVNHGEKIVKHGGDFTKSDGDNNYDDNHYNMNRRKTHFDGADYSHEIEDVKLTRSVAMNVREFIMENFNEY